MKIVLATGNMGKVEEFNNMVQDSEITFVVQSEFGVSSVEETGLTFVENALLKARHAVAQTGLPAIADDSGLVVSGLNGEPGIYSARYAGEHGSFEQCIDKVLKGLEGKEGEQRQAFFYASIVYMAYENDPTPCIVNGVWHGEILKQRQGSKGMGYDPIFYVPTHQCSAAQLELSIKNRISHRGQAMQTLSQQLGWKVVAQQTS